MAPVLASQAIVATLTPTVAAAAATSLNRMTSSPRPACLECSSARSA
jgi:hypothetical protein